MLLLAGLLILAVQPGSPHRWTLNQIHGERVVENLRVRIQKPDAFALKIALRIIVVWPPKTPNAAKSLELLVATGSKVMNLAAISRSTEIPRFHVHLFHRSNGVG